MFILAVAALLVNDHVLKQALPGWWTGKLSDVAGVAVVGVVAAVVAGRRAGVLLTAVGFAALKTVPGVAEAAAPVLGGGTLRDATDLLALGVLVPLWWWLGLPSPRPSGSQTSPESARLAWSSVPWGALGVTTLPVLSVCAAVVVGTATSCGPSPAVIQVGSAEDAVYALVANGYSDPTWVRSDDAGRTWTESDRPASAPVDAEAVADDPYGDATPLGPLESCAGGVCYQVADQRRVNRSVDGAAPSEVFALTAAEYTSISTGCSNEQRGVLTSIAAIDSGGSVSAVASLGAEGVVVGSTSGTWTRVDVLDARPPDPPPNLAVTLAELVFGPVLAVGILLTMRKRWPSWIAAIVTALGGWLAAMTIAGAAAFFEFPRVELVLGGLLAVTLVMTVVVGRSEAFVRRDSSEAMGSGRHTPPAG